MKEGNLVMFKPQGIYSKWFGGHFGTIVGVSYGSDGKLYCRVKWLQSVKYENRDVQYSNFAAERFEIYK